MHGRAGQHRRARCVTRVRGDTSAVFTRGDDGMKRLFAAIVAGFFVVGATNVMAQTTKKDEPKKEEKKKEKKGGC
jgi:hypothetical protein